MSSSPIPAPAQPSLLKGFRNQSRVIGALLLREMHTRFGRDNFGYLWLIGEPMMLAVVIGIVHSGSTTHYSNNVAPLPMAVLGYTIFIMFRGIVNRAEGAMEANAALLYHKLVSVDDVTIARALLEAGGTVSNVIILLSLMIMVGLAEPPARLLWLVAAVGYMLWLSLAQAMIVTAISHDNKTVGRLVHVYTYFNIPLSGAFMQVEWLPHPYREYILWLPLPHVFEMARYGQFEAATPDYFSVPYLTGWCMVLTVIGLLCSRIVRRHIHLS